MCINLTKKPMKPMIAKPIAVAMAIFWNSERKINQSVQIDVLSPFKYALSQVVATHFGGESPGASTALKFVMIEP